MLAGGLIAVGVIGSATLIGPRRASADQQGAGPIRSAQRTLPDLTVRFESAGCMDGMAEVKVRVHNVAAASTSHDVITTVFVDGTLAFSQDNPHITKAPLMGSQVYSLSFPASGGTHSITVMTDSGNHQPETNEANNGDQASVRC
jgi:subtilase family serine protease